MSEEEYLEDVGSPEYQLDGSTLKGLEQKYAEMGFFEKWGAVFSGLNANRDSGEYKYAKMEIVRIASPITSVAVNVILVLLLIVFVKFQIDDRGEVEVAIYEPEVVEELEDVLEEIEPEELELPEVTDIVEPPDDVEITDFTDPSPAVDFSPMPAEFDAVAMVKSPVIVKGVFGSRNPGMRGHYLKVGGGSSATEGAVLRALRWLKKNQKEDGAWYMGPNQSKDSSAAGMTGLALLCCIKSILARLLIDPRDGRLLRLSSRPSFPNAFSLPP